MTLNDFKTNKLQSWAFILIGLGLVVACFLLFQQNQLLSVQIEKETTKTALQKAMLESVRQSNSAVLISEILKKADDELAKKTTRKLSNETIERIVAVSYFFKPYQVFEGENLSEKKYSPERGQLLLLLSKMNIDTGSLSKIMAAAKFSGADLGGVDLSNAFLKGINLKGANLKEANLSKANLTDAFLRDADFRLADMKEIIASNADFNRADMELADLTDATLTGASMDGVKLINANLRRADLSKARLSCADLAGSFLKDANLEAAIFTIANLERANFSNSNMAGVDLRWAIFNETILSNAELANAVTLEANWFENLNDLRVMGIKDIQNRYEIVGDTKKKGRFVLKKKE